MFLHVSKYPPNVIFRNGNVNVQRTNVTDSTNIIGTIHNRGRLYTVQEEIFGEIARLKHLANFTLTNDIWMYYNSGCVIPYIFCWRFKYWRKIEQIANRQNKVLANKSSCTVCRTCLHSPDACILLLLILIVAPL